MTVIVICPTRMSSAGAFCLHAIVSVFWPVLSRPAGMRKSVCSRFSSRTSFKRLLFNDCPRFFHISQRQRSGVILGSRIELQIQLRGCGCLRERRPLLWFRVPAGDHARTLPAGSMLQTDDIIKNMAMIGVATSVVHMAGMSGLGSSIVETPMPCLHDPSVGSCFWSWPHCSNGIEQDEQRSLGMPCRINSQR